MRYQKQSDHHDGTAQSLGSLVKAEREAFGLSLTELAAQVGISRPYLSRLERSEYAHPSVRVLTQLSKRLDIHREDLYALAGYTLPTDLPELGPYLEAKHPEWPDEARVQLEGFYEYLRQKYEL